MPKQLLNTRPLAGGSQAGMGTDIERLGGDFPRHSNIVKHGGIVYLVGLTDDTGATTKEQTERILEKVLSK